MGGSSSREMMNPYAVNTPLMGICLASIMFNSVQGRTLRSSNVFNNLILIYALGFSTGLSTVMQQPIWGAKVGIAAALGFTFGPNLRLIYLQRLFPDYVRYGIGSVYIAYHSLQWYSEVHAWEDAMEDEVAE
ncbi:uncharacterized protein TEOVI_000661600 [Trypanosoma equiperdum]|uniref:Uncharacterized protein n=3 Tax=Trypanozoon TaxID=39700 RepID=Q381P9_TRYB2|nr:hypothetical protein, conserved [Trypanosoma brucei gambiense DAL972]XP_829594.1 hypothetical protein, conserved [Trypanosoma brucei brucei TREU927]EAN80482.1 hypothetical protein, conserved [Trypanosoma brucei brucei TREU927]CBH18604.1 hypothetical protein, conserved [Trypanosoma brucei gambiense DAL972]SCU65802.1 hypothetical protein, conserved [Trypanosoma equiperdum]|eukprot:XP_011780868.1 hypothetical protein, conserved [Trypanosoma brucei gambiense DAL972]